MFPDVGSVGDLCQCIRADYSWIFLIFSWRCCMCVCLWVWLEALQQPQQTTGLTGVKCGVMWRLSRVDMKTICRAADPQRCTTAPLWCRSSDQRGARFFIFPSNHSTRLCTVWPHHVTSASNSRPAGQTEAHFTLWAINKVQLWDLNSKSQLENFCF